MIARARGEGEKGRGGESLRGRRMEGFSLRK